MVGPKTLNLQMLVRFQHRLPNIEGSFNGRTTVSETVGVGSIPAPSANNGKQSRQVPATHC